MPRPPEPVRRLRTEIHHVALEGLELRAAGAPRERLEANRLELAALRLELSRAVTDTRLLRAAA
jgi:hypothetical protein